MPTPCVSGASAGLPAIAEPLARFQFAVGEANRLLAQIGKIDLRRYESLAAATGVQLMMQGPVSEVLGVLTDTMCLIGRVPCLVSNTPDQAPLPVDEPGRCSADAGDADDDDGADLDFDLEAKMDPFEGDARPATLERFCEEVDGALGRLTAAPRAEVNVDALDGLCHVLIVGLRQARAQLVNARQQRSKWGLIGTAEDARRKVQRALRACLCAAACLVGVAPESLPFAESQSELASAIRVRDTLMRFRADILRVTGDVATQGHKELRVAAQHAVFRIAAIVREPGYHELRALDRFNLRRLRAELESWLGEAADTENGKQVLLDLNAYADLLSSVNHREVLVQHDRQLKRQASEELEACLVMHSVQHRGAIELYHATLTRLQALRWRDEALTEQIEDELKRSDEAGLEKRVFSTLTRLAAVHV